LNNNNLEHLGQWWSEKMKNAQDSYKSSHDILEDLLAKKQMTATYFAEQWARKVESLISTTPSMFEVQLS
jgi:hypothetical protein